MLSGEAPCGAIKGAVAPQRHTVDTPCTHRPRIRLKTCEQLMRLPGSPQLWINHPGQPFVV